MSKSHRAQSTVYVQSPLRNTTTQDEQSLVQPAVQLRSTTRPRLDRITQRVSLRDAIFSALGSPEPVELLPSAPKRSPSLSETLPFSLRSSKYFSISARNLERRGNIFQRNAGARRRKRRRSFLAKSQARRENVDDRRCGLHYTTRDGRPMKRLEKKQICGRRASTCRPRGDRHDLRFGKLLYQERREQRDSQQRLRFFHLRGSFNASSMQTNVLCSAHGHNRLEQNDLVDRGRRTWSLFSIQPLRQCSFRWVQCS